MSTLEQMVDQAVYEAALKTTPGLVTVIRTLIQAGQTPAQIERYIAQRFGRNRQMTRNVRHIAEHMAQAK